MGKYWGTHNVWYARRGIRQRRLQFLSYAALSVLAAATLVVVLMAIER